MSAENARPTAEKDAYPHDDERCRQDSVDAAGFRDLCRALARNPSDALEGVTLTRPVSETGWSTPPLASESVEVVRGWRVYDDGSISPVERWVKHADGDWVSLDSARRTSGDILIDPTRVTPPAADQGASDA